MKKLRINKYDVIYFHIFRYFDKVYGNTYNMFGECYLIRKGERKYFSDMLSDQVWKPYNSFYGYGDAYQYAKEWLNKNSNLNVVYVSDHKNIIVSSEYKTAREFKRLGR